MPNSSVNHVVVQARGKVIEGDLVTGNFDPTLFLFTTGCRIGESVSRDGVRKATKVNRASPSRLTSRLQQMLMQRR